MKVRKASLLAVVGAAAAVVVMSGAADAAVGPIQDPPFAVTANVPDASLAGVSAVSASDVWAVGQDDGVPLTENWNGRQWSSVPVPAVPGANPDTNVRLTGISSDSAGDVIAVGNAILGPTAPVAFQLVKGAWQELPTPAGAWWSSIAQVKVFSATSAWAIGQTSTSTGYTATASYWNGSTWTQVATPFSTTLTLSMNSITASSPNDIWAAGTAESLGYRNRQVESVLLHYNGVSWSQVTAPDNSGLTSVASISPTDAWAVAADGNILQLSNGTWSIETTEFNSPSVATPTIAAVSATDILVAGVVSDDEYSVAKYNGASWTAAAEPTGFTQTDGAALPSGQAWFSGSVLESNGATIIPAVLPAS